MVSVMSTKDFTILGPGRFEERLLIFEEYANGGLHVLSELVARGERQCLDLVLDLIMDSEGPKESGGGTGNRKVRESSVVVNTQATWKIEACSAPH
jgi:hypothetical protein